MSVSTAPHEAESKAAAKVARVAGTTDARIAEKDAESARRLRESQAAVELRLRKIEVRRAEREARATVRDAKRTRRAECRRARRAARVARVAAAYTRVRNYIAGNMPGVYSTGIYAMALYVAVSGQLSMATERGWSPIFGFGMAAFLEGTALSMALTAHQLRLKGERALVPAAMTWVAAGFASAINFLAHRQDPILAVVLGASSLAAIIVWEVRSGAKHREALRKKGFIPDPPERFGVRRWIRYPRSTWRAWSLDVRDRVGVRAAALLAEVETTVQTTAAAVSAEAAQAAQQAALDAAAAAAVDAERALAAATAAKRTTKPARRFVFWRRAAAKTPVASTPKPARKTPTTPKGGAAKPRPSGDFTAIEEAFVALYARTGRRPGGRAIEAAVRGTEGARKKTAICDWMKDNPGRITELTVRAEAIRTGQQEVSE